MQGAPLVRACCFRYRWDAEIQSRKFRVIVPLVWRHQNITESLLIVWGRISQLWKVITVAIILLFVVKTARVNSRNTAFTLYSNLAGMCSCTVWCESSHWRKQNSRNSKNFHWGNNFLRRYLPLQMFNWLNLHHIPGALLSQITSWDTLWTPNSHCWYFGPVDVRGEVIRWSTLPTQQFCRWTAPASHYIKKGSKINTSSYATNNVSASIQQTT